MDAACDEMGWVFKNLYLKKLIFVGKILQKYIFEPPDSVLPGSIQSLSDTGSEKKILRTHF